MTMRLRMDYETMWLRLKQQVRHWKDQKITPDLACVVELVKKIEDATPPCRVDDALEVDGPR